LAHVSYLCISVSLRNAFTNVEFTGLSNTWTSLRNQTYDTKEVSFGEAKGEVITLPDGVFFMHERSRQLFVRQWQKDIFGIVNQHRLDNLDVGDLGWLVLGTPGVGKSWWMEYALLRLAGLGGACPTIVYESAEHSVLWLLRPNGTVKLSRKDPDDETFNALQDPATVYLFDCYGDVPVEPRCVICVAVHLIRCSYPPPPDSAPFPGCFLNHLLYPRHVAALTWAASSTKRTNYKQYDKRPQVDRLYVPVSTEDELIMYGRELLPPIEEDVVRERCSRHGFVFRAVLAPKPRKYDDALRGAVDNEGLERLFNAVNSLEDSGDTSHRLLHLHVEQDSDGRPTYRSAHTGFASHWVAREMVERRGQFHMDNLIAVASGQHDLGGAIRGHIYEALVRAKLRTLGEIIVYELSDEGRTDKCMSLTLSDKNVIFPSSPVYVVDALAPQSLPEGQAQPQVQEVFINFTIDLTHGIKSNAFNAMLAMHKVESSAEVIYLWIVPSDKAPMFRKQARKKSGGLKPPFSCIVQQYMFVYDVIE
jgi:hypothetical protein